MTILIFSKKHIIYLKFFSFYFSAAFCCFQKKSNCQIGLIDNEEILSTVLQGIRGGLSFVSNRILKSCPKHNPNMHSLVSFFKNIYFFILVTIFSKKNNIKFLNYFLLVCRCQQLIWFMSRKETTMRQFQNGRSRSKNSKENHRRI